MNKLKKIIILGTLLIIYFLISAINYVQATSSNISKEVFRLHVVANSDTNEDQALKHKVRDTILNYVRSISNTLTTKSDLINILESNKDEIKNLAEKTVKAEGYNYNINLNIGNFNFPTKNYGDVTLPSGYYDALKIEIGNASGQNWWCVMFPPLCFVDVTTGIVPDKSKSVLEENLNEEEYALISEDNNIIKFKFKLIEMFENINIALGKKDN